MWLCIVIMSASTVIRDHVFQRGWLSCLLLLFWCLSQSLHNQKHLPPPKKKKKNPGPPPPPPKKISRPNYKMVWIAHCCVCVCVCVLGHYLKSDLIIGIQRQSGLGSFISACVSKFVTDVMVVDRSFFFSAIRLILVARNDLHCVIVCVTLLLRPACPNPSLSSP